VSPGPIGRITALFFTALTLAGGCRSSTLTVGQADASIEQDLVRGVAQIRVVHDRKKLRTDLARVLSRLREAHGTAPGTRRGRDLAIQGFEATLRGSGVNSI
jgi:hypothetical protein